MEFRKIIKRVFNKTNSSPMPTFDERGFYHRKAQRSTNDSSHLRIGIHIRSGQGRHVDWVADWLITR